MSTVKSRLDHTAWDCQVQSANDQLEVQFAMRRTVRKQNDVWKSAAVMPYQVGLLDEKVGVLAEVVEYCLGSRSPVGGLRLACH